MLTSNKQNPGGCAGHCPWTGAFPDHRAPGAGALQAEGRPGVNPGCEHGRRQAGLAVTSDRALRAWPGMPAPGQAMGWGSGWTAEDPHAVSSGPASSGGLLLPAGHHAGCGRVWATLLRLPHSVTVSLLIEHLSGHCYRSVLICVAVLTVPCPPYCPCHPHCPSLQSHSPQYRLLGLPISGPEKLSALKKCATCPGLSVLQGHLRRPPGD